MAEIEIDVHDASHVQEATKVDLIVEQVASEEQMPVKVKKKKKEEERWEKS
jgi:antitoxin component of RelBE/YafQ-DinJ toxin-antitoxin module